MYEYDDWSNITKITTPAGSQYTYKYNFKNLLKEKYIPGGGTTEYTYNSRDLLHAQTDAKGQKQSFEYDDYDRITKVYLGDIGSNEVLIDNSYYTTGHIDKIESSTSMVFDPEGDGTITDHFVYNQFGQVENQTYNHPAGIVDITYVFDKADRLLTTTTIVPGANSNAVETQIFDNYDRLLESGISFGEESAVLASCRYNQRGELWIKNIGSEFVQLIHDYHIRGWLHKINNPFEGGSPLVSCQTPTTEPDAPPSGGDTTTTPVFVNEMTVMEFLRRRFDLEIEILDGEEDCIQEECPPPDCDTGEIEYQQQKITEFRDRFREIAVDYVNIPCSEDSIVTEEVIDVKRLPYPLELRLLRLCDGSQVYVLKEFMSSGQPLPNVEVLQTIEVTSAGQTFEVEHNDSIFVYYLEDVLGLVLEGGALELDGYVSCGEPDCSPRLACPPAEQMMQQAAIDLLRENFEHIHESDLLFPLWVYEGVICEGGKLYLLESELPYLENTTIRIVDSIYFAGPEQTVPVGLYEEPEEKPGNSSREVFYLEFDYRPDGIIRRQRWQVIGRNEMRYQFSYDGPKRLTGATFSERLDAGWTGENRYGVFDISYDADGNIKTLGRNGPLDPCANGLPNYGAIDRLRYLYGGEPNQVRHITDNGNERGYDNRKGPRFAYDLNGNVTSTRGFTIDYNLLNLPKQISTDEGEMQIVYDASGRKLEKRGGEENIVYIGNVELGAVTRLNGAGGRIVKGEGISQVEYFVKDHLGNTRLVLRDADGDRRVERTGDPETEEVLSEHHYYPFGMQWEGNWYDTEDWPKNQYTYNGKEFNGDFGLDWLDYGARWYEAGIGRFTGVDPISDRFPWVSTFNYAENEPVAHIDLWGLQKAKPEERGKGVDYKSGTGGSPINIYNSQLRLNYSREAAKLEPFYSPDKLTAQHSYGVLKRTEMKESTRARMIGGRAHLDKADPIEPKFSADSPDKSNPRFFKTNKGMTNLAKVSRVSGALGVGVTTYELGKAANEGRFVEQAQVETGKFVGALAGMKLMSETVALSPFPFTKHPVVATIMVGIGGIVGSIAGEQGVQDLQERVNFEPPERTGMGFTTCFVAGTKILMSDGSDKNIELVKEGDLILGVNIELMKIEVDTVTLIPEIVSRYKKIRVEFEDNQSVEFSPAHPFWIVDKGWSVYDLEEAKKELDFEVNQMQVGDFVLRYQNGDLVKVKITSLYDTGEIVEMYNLEHVSKNHSFFADKILVHNKRQ